MALGNFYLGENGARDDTLSRVAFIIKDDLGKTVDSYYFNLNPSQMTASYPARNIFNQTLHTVLMQGYGMGIHTIQIQGQTGYMKYALLHRGPTGWGTGFQKAKRLKEILTRQINNAHDSGSPSQMTTLYFMNYTDEVAYKVELDQNGLQFQQSNQDPLTFYYTVDMVVIAPAYEPNPDEYSLAKLGNIYVPMAGGPYVKWKSFEPSDSGTPIDRGMLYRHPDDEHDSNLQAKDGTLIDLDHDKGSILDTGLGKNIDSIERKQLFAYGLGKMPADKQAAILDIIGSYQQDNPLVHLTYDGRRPLDIQLGNTPNDSNLLYWQKWIHGTKNIGDSDVGVDDDSSTGYKAIDGQYTRTLPDGDRIVYSSSDSTNPSGVVTAQGAYYPTTASNQDFLNQILGNMSDINSGAESTTPYSIPTASTNYVVNDEGVINSSYIDTVFDLDVKSYFSQNANDYVLNSKVVTPNYMNGTDVSEQTNNDFNFDLQQDFSNNTSIQVNGQSIAMATAFQGSASPGSNSTDEDYHKAKGNNYVVTYDHQINPVLTAYISQWINKYLTPSVVLSQMANNPEDNNITTVNPNQSSTSPLSNTENATNDIITLKDDNGIQVSVPKTGVKIENRNGINYIYNTNSGALTPLDPATSENLSNNALSMSKMIIDNDGQITVQPKGTSTNGDDSNPENDSQYATDTTTVIDKNGKMEFKPNQYSTTGEGISIPENEAQNASNVVTVKLANGKLQLEAKNGPDTQPRYDYGEAKDYLIVTNESGIHYVPLMQGSNGYDQNYSNVVKNATNWTKVTSKNGHIIFQPYAPGFSSNIPTDKGNGLQKPNNSQPTFIGGSNGSHTEIHDNHVLIVPNNHGGTNVISSSSNKINTVIVDDNVDTEQQNSVPVNIDN